VGKTEGIGERRIAAGDSRTTRLRIAEQRSETFLLKMPVVGQNFGDLFFAGSSFTPSQ
jgi:hypothetical protein